MTFPKPSVTYTEMCKWIDQHGHDPNCDAEKLFIYIYHLANMLAHKLDFFTNTDSYDKFSLHVASKIYVRLQTSSANCKKIKNILDYLKKVMYPMKVDFCKANLATEYTGEMEIYSLDSQSEFTEYLVDQSSLFDKIEFSFAIGGISAIVQSYLQKIPIKHNSAQWENIYISCMLTLLNSMTPSTGDLAEFGGIDDLTTSPKSIEKLYISLRYHKPVLFHLDYKYAGYIQVLVNEIKRCIAAELSWTTSVHLSSSTVAKNLISSSIELSNET